jgi:hypothetical protein
MKRGSMYDFKGEWFPEEQSKDESPDAECLNEGIAKMYEEHGVLPTITSHKGSKHYYIDETTGEALRVDPDEIGRVHPLYPSEENYKALDKEPSMDCEMTKEFTYSKGHVKVVMTVGPYASMRAVVSGKDSGIVVLSDTDLENLKYILSNVKLNWREDDRIL